MAKKTKRGHSEEQQRQGFFSVIRSLAVFVYWFASFILIVLEIWNILKNW